MPRHSLSRLCLPWPRPTGQLIGKHRARARRRSRRRPGVKPYTGSVPATTTLPSPTRPAAAPAARNVRALGGLMPFVRPYRVQIAFAALFLVLAAVSTLIFPVALKSLIDEGFISADPGARVMALRDHFFALFAVGVALGVFSAARFYMVSWLGERITADLRNGVYAHVV